MKLILQSHILIWFVQLCSLVALYLGMLELTVLLNLIIIAPLSYAQASLRRFIYSSFFQVALLLDSLIGFQTFHQWVPYSIDFPILFISLYFPFLIHPHLPKPSIPFINNLDHLTGLMTHLVFKEKVNILIQRQSPFHLIHFEIAGISKINRLYGTEYGDVIIKKIVSQFQEILPTSSHFAKFSSLQFYITLLDTQASDVRALLKLLQSTLDAISSEVDNASRLTLDAGVVHYPTDSDLTRDLLNFANTARIHAKRNSELTVQFFEKSIQKKALRSLQIQAQFHRAMKENQFQLHFQPKINIQKNKITGIEALLRWESSKLGWVSPGEFIPIAEESGFIVELGEFVVQEGVRFLAHLQSIGYSQVKLSVNVSPRQFIEGGVPELIERQLNHFQIPSHQLEIEITEGLLLADNQTIHDQILKIKNQGVGISLDDFGTGYASLSYLTKYPFTSLKIDRSFVNRITESDELKSIVKNCIQLGKDLNLETIAEGVEDEDQYNFFSSTMCDTIQGWYYAKAMAWDEFEEYLRQYQNPN